MVPIGARSGPTTLRFYSTSYRSRSRSFFKGASIVAGVGSAGFVTLYFTNDQFHESVRHSFLTLKRIGVVTMAASKCFYLYGQTLHVKKYDSEEERQTLLSETHKTALLITLKALETNGGIYIKLGQHVSAMTYLLPREWTDAMIPLQQKCPESDFQEINEMFISDLGKPVEEIFTEFDHEPIGVASLAQVHIGRLRETGKRVAVKCQHPSLEEFVPVDVIMCQKVFKLMYEIFPEYPLTWLGEELQSSIYVELDFNNEAKNARNTAQYFQKFLDKTALRVPEVLDSSRRILIMEYVPGSRLDDLEFMDSHKISRSQVSSCLSHIFNNMIFTPNVGVHCDPHGGNLAIRSVTPTKENPHNFEIVLYDHGLYRQIPDQMRIDYAKFWLSLLDKDVKGMERNAMKFANITEEQFPILAAAITGRDFEHALGGDIASARGDDEINNMTDALVKKGQILDLMSLLSQLPRIVLLILKTNDLTRHLDEDLQNPLGLERTFFILATYCAHTVLIDELDRCSKYKKGISWLIGEVKAYWKYYKRVDQLFWYDLVMNIRNLWYRL